MVELEHQYNYKQKHVQVMKLYKNLWKKYMYIVQYKHSKELVLKNTLKLNADKHE